MSDNIFNDIDEKMSEFSENQKSFFLSVFQTGEKKKKESEVVQLGDEMRDDIKKYFSGKVARDKNLKRTLKIHQKTDEIHEKKGTEKVEVKVGEKKKFHQHEDSRVVFAKMTTSMRGEQRPALGDKIPARKMQSFSQKVKNEGETFSLDDLHKKFLFEMEDGSTQSPSKSVVGKEAVVEKGKVKGKRKTMIFFDRILSGIVSEKRFAKKNSKEVEASLVKYQQKLEELLKTCNRKCFDLDKKIGKNIKDLKDGIMVYRNNSLISLLNYFRFLCLNRKLRLEIVKMIEVRSAKLIERRLDLIEKALSCGNDPSLGVSGSSRAKKKKSLGKWFPSYINQGFFSSVDDMCEQDREIVLRSMQVRILDGIIPQMDKIYQIERKINVKGRSKKEMKNSLEELLSHTYDTYLEEHIDNYEEFIFQDETQDQFNKIVRDVRTDEGQSISNFLSAISHFGGLRKIPPYEITDYIESFIEMLKKLYKFDVGQVRKLRQLTDRLFYGSLVGFEVLSMEYETLTAPKTVGVENSSALDEFVRKKLLLRKLPASTLGVDEKFLDKDSKKIPFKKAIDILDNLEYILTPSDMIWTIYCSCKAITNEASAICEKNKKKWSFGADELLPVVIHVIVHANCPYLLAHLSFISKFSPKEKKSESVYYLTCFQGAVMYISDKTTEELHLLIGKELKKSGKGKQKSDSRKIKINELNRESFKKLISLVKK